MSRRFIALLIASMPLPATAQSVGDTVIVIRDDARLKNADGVVTEVWRGLALTVRRVDDKSLRVVGWMQNYGWIDKQNVLLANQALDYFNSAIRKKPTATDYRCRAEVWRALGEHDKAITDYDNAIRLAPNDGLAFYGRGRAWDFKRQNDKAITDYSKAIELDPKNAGKYYVNRAVSWWRKREPDEAIADCNAALKVFPKYAAAYNNRGMAWFDKGEYDKAMADYSAAIRLDPEDSAESYFNRGNLWFRKGIYEKAAEDYGETIRQRPSDYSARVFRASAFSHNNEHDRAIAEYTRAIEHHPNPAVVYVYRATEWDLKRDYRKAEADYIKAINLDPKLVLAHSSLGWMYATCSDPEYRDGIKAIKHATKACELTKWKVPVMSVRLAAAYAESGDFKEAVDLLRKVMAELPKPYKMEAQKMLKLFQQEKPYRREASPLGGAYQR